MRADVRLPVEPRAGRRVVAVDHAARVREHVAHQHALLARLRELRPVARDRRVEIDEPAIDQDVRAERAHALRHRVHDDDGVLGPRHRALQVLVAAPQVDDLLAVLVHAHRGAHLAALAEIALEFLAHRGEARVADAVDEYRCLDCPGHGWIIGAKDRLRLMLRWPLRKRDLERVRFEAGSRDWRQP